MTMAQLMLAYLRHADAYYRRPDGTPASEPKSVRDMLRIVKPLYADLPASEFGFRLAGSGHT